MTTTFATVFFRIYDRKILSGEITFSQTGITKEDFTRICTDKTFIPPRAELERMCRTMKLNEEESRQLLQFARD